MQKELAAGDYAYLKTVGTIVVIFEVNETGAYCRWRNGSRLEGETFDLGDLGSIPRQANTAAG